MLSLPDIDVLEQNIFDYDSRILEMLLLDQTTKARIIWATNDYESYGNGFGFHDQISVVHLIGEYQTLIQPRTEKNEENQINRTRNNAEVFTPCWVCNEQNNLIDNQWFGRKDVFNIECEQAWHATTAKIIFPENRSWQDYVKEKRMEITCGEAPYLVSRYDTTTGKAIPVHERIGMLDRKLRVVSENTNTSRQWIWWAKKALKSIYGYEYQGDNLLIARENVFASIVDHYTDKFNVAPSRKWLPGIAEIISWNLWQMDGIRCVIPDSCQPVYHESQNAVMNLFGDEEPVQSEPCPGCAKGLIHEHTGIKCKIKDWDKSPGNPEYIFTFESMIKE